MTSRQLCIILTFVYLSSFTTTASAMRGRPSKQPNVLFILADDMGWMDSELYGSQYYEMPSLSRLAQRGMRFTNAYAASPLCSPTRASILTGKAPERLGITTPACHLAPLKEGTPLLGTKAGQHQPMVTPQSKRFLPLSELTLAEAFHEAGYHTGFIGKWHLGRNETHWPRHQGFDFDLGAWNPGPPSYFVPYRFQTIPDGPEGEYITDRITDEAIAYLERHRHEPFLLCWWHFAVHAPYQAKQEMISRFRRKADPRGLQDCPTMGAMLKSMDDGLGRVLDKLDELKLTEKTIIVFVSDNGGNMYDEVDDTTPTNNAPLRGGKGNSYEGGTRSPCVVVWPGIVEPNSHSSALLSTVDFYPTLLEMTNLPLRLDQHLDGVSQVPVLKQLSPSIRDMLFCHFPHYTPATQNRPNSSVRQGDWKLLRFYGEGPQRNYGFELYHLGDDIGEQQNLADLYPLRVAELNAHLDTHLSQTQALVPIKNPAYEAPTPGWQAAGDAQITTTSDSLSVNSKGKDPYIVTEDLPIVSHRLVLQFRMQTTITGQGSFYWRDNKAAQYNKDQMIRFDIPQDGRWHDYAVSFWSSGRLKGLRIDPGTSSGRAEIRDLRLVRRYGEDLKQW